MKQLSIIALALAALVSFGCAKDYLETYPTGSVKPETAFETTESANVTINGLNKIMNRQYGAYGQGYNGEGTIRLYIGDYLGDKLMPGNNTGFMNSANGDLYHSKTASLGGYAWYYYYTLIGNANAVLNNIDNAAGGESDKEYIKAQALCYRAYAYSNLVQIYGRRWSDGPDKLACVLRLTGDEPDNLDRSTVGDVYKQIYADLDQAISLFNSSGKANSRKNAYTMDLDVAYAIYARTALTREDWNTALKYAQLARKSYPLMSVAEEKAGFCNPTSEWIWYLYGTDDETLYYYSYFAYIAYNSNAGNVRNYPKLISKHLFDQIPKTDIRRAFWLDPADYPGTYNTNTNKASKQTTANKLYVYGFKYAQEDGRVGLYSTASVFAYMQFKIHDNTNPGVGNMVLFRSSEMLLIEAEAQYRMNNEAAAQALLVELNATSKRDPAYTCTATGNALMEQIKLYRGIELWGEGFSWFDLKRWGDSISRKAYKDGGNWMSSYAISYGPNEKNNWTWCIPQQETDYNKGISSTAN
ncbi:MAG: RagB/SusD family nutrient uptake outer membrane protein [Bacteroidales bacterium]|nr:RagB/SusD family nutrient uptake outer membrane protein [Bacteroidales bacterium]MBR6423995.1 RagB/SusD family nutrient uptake outer membrane protein [Bacteroidales bacterium]